MKMRTTDFKTSGYFPWTVIFLGLLLAFVGLLLLTKTIIVGLITLVVSLLILTTHYRLTIDFDNKLYHDYLWILGIKHGDKGKFETIEYLFIKRSAVTQKMNLRVASSSIRKEVFDAYLKFSENDKIHLMTKDNKKYLIQKIKTMASKLQLDIVDYSGGTPIKFQ